jgi:hypothetical protein
MSLPPPESRRAFSSPTTGERVTDVRREPDGTITVVTQLAGRRATYRECKDVVRLGQYIEQPIKSRTVSYSIAWSPWDDADDD